jgi:hypothetical protein
MYFVNYKILSGKYSLPSQRKKIGVVMMKLISLMLFSTLLQTILGDNDGSLILKIAIPTGGISAILYLIWQRTFKYSLKQNQAQFEFALEQNQSQFQMALNQIEKQHKEALEQFRIQYIESVAETRRTNDKLFEIIRKDAEYKEILTGVLAEMKNNCFYHIADHKRSQ